MNEAYTVGATRSRCRDSSVWLITNMAEFWGLVRLREGCTGELDLLGVPAMQLSARRGLGVARRV